MIHSNSNVIPKDNTLTKCQMNRVGYTQRQFEQAKRAQELYIEVLKAIYSMLEAALLWYKTFRKDLEDNRFIFNLYGPCVANKKVQGLQQTIIFHVDNLKSSHKSKSVNNKFEKW
jgi:hypothetical protein